MGSPLRRLIELGRELKRRRVYRVTAVYVVVAAAAIELLDVVLPSTRLPDWADELFLGIALLGLPVVIVLAWAYEATPEGIRRDRSSALDAPEAPRSDPTSVDPASTPAPVSSARPGRERATSSGGQDPKSVAVVPFENLTATPEAEPFTVGLHHDLITELARVSALTVISGTSVSDYRRSGKPVSQIGRELDVGTVVEGAVQYAGGRVRLNVQVIDARSGVHRWAERYDRELTTEDIFALQSELADAITNTLQAELTPEERSRIRPTPTESLDAYRLFSKGRAHLDKRTRTSVETAIECFEEAIRHDSGYGPAWTGLAEGLGLAEYYDYDLQPDAPDAMEAAERAVDLAPQSAEAHTARAIIQALRHKGPAARASLGRAIELKPSDADAHAWLGWLHLVLGEPELSLEPAARATELDPRAPATWVFRAESLLANGNAPAALAQAERGRRLQPDYDLARFMEGLALYHLGRLEKAREVFEGLLPGLRRRGTPSSGEVQAILALTRIAAGDRREARRVLARVREDGHSFATGLLLAGLGESDAALDAFEGVPLWESFETEHVRYFFPETLDPLRDHPRFGRLLSTIDRDWGLDATSNTAPSSAT